MSDLKTRFSALKDKSLRDSQAKSRAEGTRDTLIQTLLAKHGVDSVDAAQKLLASLMKEYKDLELSITTALTDLENSFESPEVANG